MKRETILRWTDEVERHPVSVFPAGFAEFWDGVLARPFDKADMAPVPLRELATKAREKEPVWERIEALAAEKGIILTGVN